MRSRPNYVPLAAIAITLFSIDLVIASNNAASGAGALVGISEFLGQPANWRLLGDMALIAMCGGLYVVPLFAIVQSRSDAEHRSRTIASNNVINALFMVTATVAMVLMLQGGFSIPDIFLAVAIANAGVAVYICKLLPDETIKSIGRMLFRLLHRVEVKGWDNYKAAGDRVVIVANHTSLLDAPVLGSFLPDTPVFGINTQVADKWWVKPAYLMFDLLPLDPTNPMALRALVQRVKEGGKCVIFPEGRLTMTGGLMKVYEGPGAIADMADATLLPIRIDGAQYSFFSRLRGVLRLRLFPKITITIMPPERIELDDAIKGAARRQIIGTKLYGRHGQYGVRDLEPAPDPVRGPARRPRRPWRKARRHRGRRTQPHELQPPGARQFRARPPHRDPHRPWRTCRHSPAQCGRRRGQLLRASCLWPRARHAQLLDRLPQHGLRLSDGSDQDCPHVAPVH